MDESPSQPEPHSQLSERDKDKNAKKDKCPSETPSTPKQRRKSIKIAESKLDVLPPEHAQALFTVSMMEEAVFVLVTNLRATKRMWSQVARDFVEIPDGPT